MIASRDSQMTQANTLVHFSAGARCYRRPRYCHSIAWPLSQHEHRSSVCAFTQGRYRHVFYFAVHTITVSDCRNSTPLRATPKHSTDDDKHDRRLRTAPDGTRSSHSPAAAFTPNAPFHHCAKTNLNRDRYRSNLAPKNPPLSS